MNVVFLNSRRRYISDGIRVDPEDASSRCLRRILRETYEPPHPRGAYSSLRTERGRRQMHLYSSSDCFDHFSRLRSLPRVVRAVPRVSWDNFCYGLLFLFYFLFFRSYPALCHILVPYCHDQFLNTYRYVLINCVRFLLVSVYRFGK